MSARLAPALLTLGGLLHLGGLVVLALPISARTLTTGDAAFLTGFGSVYLIAARALTRQQRWGRWLGMAASGVEAIPSVVLLYVLLVFSADPANQGSIGRFGFLTLLLFPLVVFIVVWRHRPADAG